MLYAGMWVLFFVAGWKMTDNFVGLVLVAFVHAFKRGTDAGRARMRDKVPGALCACVIWAFLVFIAVTGIAVL